MFNFPIACAPGLLIFSVADWLFSLAFFQALTADGLRPAVQKLLLQQRCLWTLFAVFAFCYWLVIF